MHEQEELQVPSTRELDEAYTEAFSKKELLEKAAYHYIYDVPFPARMRRDLLRWKVTPEQFEGRTVVALLGLDVERGLPPQAQRPEVQEMYSRWLTKAERPLSKKDLEEHPRLEMPPDTNWYMQLYSVPLTPSRIPASLPPLEGLAIPKL